MPHYVRRLMLALLTASLSATTALLPMIAHAAKPPMAMKIPKTLVTHGDARVDDYFWLRDKENPEVLAYLKAENAYTVATLAPYRAFEDQLYQEMLARIQETDQDVPYAKDGYWYYTRTETGKQYKIYCRKRSTPDAREEIVLDLNELAKGKAFLALDQYEVSPDGNWLAYSLDFSGFRDYTLFFKNLATGEVLGERIEKVSSAAWANDNRTIFYVTEDRAKRPFRLHRHQLGGTLDQVLFEETDELYRLSVGTTRSRGWVVATSLSSEASEVRVLPASRPLGEFELIAKRRHGHRYFVDHHREDFFIRTNDKGANFRLVKAPVTRPTQGGWREVIAHRKSVYLEDIEIFDGFMVAVERESALPRLRVLDFKGKGQPISMPEAVYTTSVGVNAEFKTNTFRFNYTSMVTPASVFDFDVATGKRELKKQQPVLGGFDASQYASQRAWAPAKDGARIPLSLVYKKSLRETNRPQPLLLLGYGSYGISFPVNFSSSRLSLLDRGVVLAIAHVRGGSELGKPWHDAGKMQKKQNTFSDFIAAAEYLIAKRYTTPNQLIIQGGSAGGLLMGAVTNQRPDLFKAVVSQVPFVDVMNTMLDASLPLTVGEYLEWGNPNEKAAYQTMRAYSPYDNLEKKAYPAILVETSWNDSQVMYWEAAKYVAKLRATKTDSNPLLLKTNLDAGHGGASGRYDYLKEIAFTYTFMLSQWGLTGPSSPGSENTKPKPN